eukprot:GHUV01040932.1.p2 GENE.GHUV01040932.1~~GHUV01040932.1.p2  ORF type:complete len:136 (+),score=14.60 GHUV01040932.1:336-743(+)
MVLVQNKVDLLDQVLWYLLCGTFSQNPSCMSAYTVCRCLPLQGCYCYSARLQHGAYANCNCHHSIRTAAASLLHPLCAYCQNVRHATTLQAVVSPEEAIAMARKLGLKFYRTCVKEDLNVTEGGCDSSARKQLMS